MKMKKRRATSSKISCEGGYCQRHRVMKEKEEKEGVAASGKGSGLKEG